ncbi:hypothetical protein Bca4012_056717 [Brassica carinata]
MSSRSMSSRSGGVGRRQISTETTIDLDGDDDGSRRLWISTDLTTSTRKTTAVRLTTRGWRDVDDDRNERKKI